MRKMQRAGTSRTIQSINDSKVPTIMICEVSDIGAREPTGHVLYLSARHEESINDAALFASPHHILCTVLLLHAFFSGKTAV